MFDNVSHCYGVVNQPNPKKCFRNHFCWRFLLMVRFFVRNNKEGMVNMIGVDTTLNFVFKGYFQGYKGSKFQYISYIMELWPCILLLRRTTRGQHLITTGHISDDFSITKWAIWPLNPWKWHLKPQIRVVSTPILFSEL